MSLVTQCPQCALLFQVPADQLALSQGRVRCAQCAHEFAGEAFAITVPTHEPSLNADSHMQLPTESLLSSPRIDVEALLRRKDVASEPLPARAAPLVPMQQPELALPAVPTVPLKPDLRIESAAVGAARRTAWVLRAMAVLLAAGLCVQSLVFFRSELAAQMPASRPALEALCRLTACTLEPLRRWNGIVIDSSSLVRGDAGYILNLSLRNSVDVPLAMTSMELTLTDDQDRVLMRRVLSPSALGAPGLLAAGQAWERVLWVEPVVLEPEISGYRLVSFYP